MISPITPGIYANRDGVLYVVESVRRTGFVVGRKAETDKDALAVPLITWFPGGRWIDGMRESQMDLVKRVGDFVA